MRLIFPATLILAIGAADLAAQIPMCDFTRTYTANRIRGYYFQCPSDFVVTHLQVPDESAQGTQSVALYKMTAIPPVYPASRPETAIFYKGDVKSGTKIAVMPPAVYKKGEWFGVLGSCAVNAASTVQANSYGVADYPSRLAGTPVTLSRFISQQIIGQFKGNVACSSVTAGTISRVICWIAHQGGTETFGAGSGGTPPSLARSDPNPPSIGFKAGLLAKAGTATNKGGAWVFGLKRTAQKIPGLGTINVLPIVATVPVAVIPATGTTLSINIPKNNQFIGAKIPMQLAVLEGYGLGLSNGAEWQIGK